MTAAPKAPAKSSWLREPARSACCNAPLAYNGCQPEEFLRSTVYCNGVDCFRRYVKVVRKNPLWRDGDKHQKKWFVTFRDLTEEEMEAHGEYEFRF